MLEDNNLWPLTAEGISIYDLRFTIYDLRIQELWILTIDYLRRIPLTIYGRKHFNLRFTINKLHIQELIPE